MVRQAAAGETITTLDAVERRLTAGRLVIADGQGAVAVAGVMGGERSGIGGGDKARAAGNRPRQRRSIRA